MKGCELGAVDYVTKSFNATELLRRVHTHLQLSFLQQDLARQVEEQTARRL
ncbi:MAG TPA: hybrid sensor histidine kinase/response regulator, partial [Candidatus Latescibacteria bacterium]|nr:hybrid sensor histidine kinase/response regulator [Candidatus Latescibacterota bacterium]